MAATSDAPNTMFWFIRKYDADTAFRGKLSEKVYARAAGGRASSGRGYDFGWLPFPGDHEMSCKRYAGELWKSALDEEKYMLANMRKTLGEEAVAPENPQDSKEDQPLSKQKTRGQTWTKEQDVDILEKATAGIHYKFIAAEYSVSAFSMKKRIQLLKYRTQAAMLAKQRDTIRALSAQIKQM